jgi:hypothetical protein
MRQRLVEPYIHDGLGETAESARGTQCAKSFKPPTIDMRTRLPRASSNDIHNNIYFRSLEFDTTEGEEIGQHVRKAVIVLWVQL